MTGGGALGGGVGAAEGAADAVAAGGAGMGAAPLGTTAQASPAATKSVAPSAGSHSGVCGSSSVGGVASACRSLMGTPFYHTRTAASRFSHPESPLPDRRLHLRRAMLTAVKRTLSFGAALALALATVHALAQPPARQPLPPLPEAGSTAQTSSSGLPAGPLTPQQLYERVRRGVVALERNGIPVAVGTVLGGDGRILTALSGLGGGDGADVRYADGTTVHAKVGHADQANDLALLVPQSGKWTDGLTASEVDPSGAELRAMLPARGAHLGPTEAGVKGRVDAHARDGEPLVQMLDVDVKGPLVAGAPLLDSTGSVVALLVRACKGAAPRASAQDSPWAAWSGQAAPPKGASAASQCAPVVVGAPVSTIRAFLAHTPTTAVAPAPWLGMRGEPEASGSVRGVRVVAVAPSSPAEKSGLKPGSDVIVAVDGQPIDSPEKLADSIGKHVAGETVKLLVFGQEKFREVAVALRAAP